MRVTVTVAGQDDREIEVAEAADGETDDDGDDGRSTTATTYADLVRAVGLSPQEATALVDGRPVPDDAHVDADRVEVLRLIEGG